MPVVFFALIILLTNCLPNRLTTCWWLIWWLIFYIHKTNSVGLHIYGINASTLIPHPTGHGNVLVGCTLNLSSLSEYLRQGSAYPNISAH